MSPILPTEGKWFQQVFGTAIGSPVSVTVANLVMEDVEERALVTRPHPLSFWKQYVDDTFTALSEWEVNQFFDYLDMGEPTIKFTIERESNGLLTFLDTWSPTTLMDVYPHRCTGRRPTLTGTWSSPPITP